MCVFLTVTDRKTDGAKMNMAADVSLIKVYAVRVCVCTCVFMCTYAFVYSHVFVHTCMGVCQLQL